jgi:hypothetical protein
MTRTEKRQNRWSTGIHRIISLRVNRSLRLSRRTRKRVVAIDGKTIVNGLPTEGKREC